jgi:hypothetical protein
MLVELYPRMHRRFTTLPVLGPIVDSLVAWLLAGGYSADRVREYCRAARRLDGQLARRGVRHLHDLTRARLRACAPADSQEDPDRAALVRLLVRFLETETTRWPARTPSRLAQRLAVYGVYLRDVRNSSASSTPTRTLVVWRA